MLIAAILSRSFIRSSSTCLLAVLSVPINQDSDSRIDDISSVAQCGDPKLRKTTCRLTIKKFRKCPSTAHLSRFDTSASNPGQISWQVQHFQMLGTRQSIPAIENIGRLWCWFTHFGSGVCKPSIVSARRWKSDTLFARCKCLKSCGC